MTTSIIPFGTIERELRHSEDRAALFADPRFQERLGERIDAAIPDAATSLLALDVFDTLLWRDERSELTRFLEISERIAEARGHPGADDVLIGRMLAQRIAYRSGPTVDGCREGTLDEIHALLADLTFGDPAVAAPNIAVELDYETELLVPNPFLVETMVRHRAAGGRVVLVSDMYLTGAHIATLVERLIPGVAVDKIYSSADYKVSKRSGLIFDLIASEAEGARRFLMVGDSVEADFRMASTAGWSTVLLPIPEPLRRAVHSDHESTRRLLEGRGVDLGTWVEGVAR